MTIIRRVLKKSCMKCELLPTEEQKKKIDAAIKAVSLTHNAIIYNSVTYGDNTVEKPYKPSKKALKNLEEKKIRQPEDTDQEYADRCEWVDALLASNDKTVHFFDYNKAFSASYINALIEKDPRIAACPVCALTTNVGLAGRFSASKKKHPFVESYGGKFPYYTDKDPCRSYSYTELFSKICFDGYDIKSKSGKINLQKIGNVKFRVSNKKMKICDPLEIAAHVPTNEMQLTRTFREYVEYINSDEFKCLAKNDKFLHTFKTLTVCVSKEIDKYYIVFSLSYVVSHEEYESDVPKQSCGVDAGVHNNATIGFGISSDLPPIEYRNPRFVAKDSKYLNKLNRRNSREYGPKNPKYREERKKCRQRKEPDPKVSKSYTDTKTKYAKKRLRLTNRKTDIFWKIAVWLATHCSKVGLETLSVKEMIEFAGKNLGLTKRQIKNFRNQLTEASMAQLLLMIKYECHKRGRDVYVAGRYFASSQICNCCGYKNKEVKNLNVRKWKCPNCGHIQVRDPGASNNLNPEDNVTGEMNPNMTLVENTILYEPEQISEQTS